MAKTVDLITRAKGLAAQLNEDINTEELNHAQATALVKSLEARLEAPVEEAPVEEAPVEAIEGEYCLAHGRSVTATKGRILGPKDAVQPEDLAGGESAFKALLEKGVIVKR
jgi:hypothetical protein